MFPDRILIVDDTEVNREMLKAIFINNHEIILAENGESALAKLKEFNYDFVAVLINLNMPVMNGLEFLQKIKEQGGVKIPFILMTMDDSDEKLMESYELGVVDIIHPPFHFGIVNHRVENMIELYKHKHKLESLVDEQADKIINQHEHIQLMQEFVIDTLGTVVEFRSLETAEHVKKIRYITNDILREVAIDCPEYRLTPEKIRMISHASVMHDIGKIAIPDSILNKPGRLTVEEFEAIKQHTLKGSEIIDSMEYMKRDPSYKYFYDICRYHHERWDGRGYPDHLKGDEIPLSAQVVSIADVYDALISKRVYKPAFTPNEAIDMIINGQCGAFNPKLLACFLRVEKSLRSQMDDAIIDYE